MPTIRNKTTGAVTVCGVNSAPHRLARRQPQRYELVDNPDEPATPDERRISSIAAQATQERERHRKPAEDQAEDQTGEAAPDDAG